MTATDRVERALPVTQSPQLSRCDHRRLSIFHLLRLTHHISDQLLNVLGQPYSWSSWREGRSEARAEEGEARRGLALVEAHTFAEGGAEEEEEVEAERHRMLNRCGKKTARNLRKDSNRWP